MSDHIQNELIGSETNSNNFSSTTENNEDVKSSRSTEVLGVDEGSKTIESIGEESHCETMPLTDPSIPDMSMSTSPTTAKSPSSTFDSPVGPAKSPSSTFASPVGSTNNEEKVTPSKFTMSLVSDYGFSDDEDAIIEMRNIDKDLLPVVLIKEEIIDSDMDENVSKEYQNEKIEFSPKVTNSSGPLNEENEDAIVETERHNIDKDLLPVILIKEEVEIIESDMEENFSKECQNEKIEVLPKVTNSSGLLNEENTDNYRYTVDIASGTDDSESDSDDSSSDESSSDSSSDSEDETMKSAQAQAEQEALNKVNAQLEGPSPDDLAIFKLPPIEDLRITVSEEESQPIGTIFSIVEQQVVIQALPNVPTIDLESILFLENGKRSLGKVFDVFGPVQEPLYTVRFNSIDHIKEKGFNIGDPVYFAPQTEHTQFVVLSDLMRVKGSDASWENNKEPPSKFIDYSDDEQESAARQQRKQEKLLQEGIPVNEFKPQRKRPRGQGQKPNPFSNSGSRPSRAPVRFAQRQHNQPWTPRPSGPSGQARVPPAMPHHPNPDNYDQWNGEYQFGGPPQFPPANQGTNWHQTGPGPNWPHSGPGPNWHQTGPGNNWPHAGPRMNMGPPGMNNGPPPHMGPPANHGGPPPMFDPQHMHQPPPPSYSDAPVPHQNHAYPPSQENWWAPGPPHGAYYQPPPPPPQRHY